MAEEREGGGEDDLSAASFTPPIFQEILGCANVSVGDVNQWLDVDAEDVGFQLFNDDEMVSKMLDKDRR